MHFIETQRLVNPPKSKINTGSEAELKKVTKRKIVSKNKQNSQNKRIATECNSTYLLKLINKDMPRTKKISMDMTNNEMLDVLLTTDPKTTNKINKKKIPVSTVTSSNYVKENDIQFALPSPPSNLIPQTATIHSQNSSQHVQNLLQELQPFLKQNNITLDSYETNTSFESNDISYREIQFNQQSNLPPPASTQNYPPDSPQHSSQTSPLYDQSKIFSSQTTHYPQPALAGHSPLDSPQALSQHSSQTSPQTSPIHNQSNAISSQTTPDSQPALVEHSPPDSPQTSPQTTPQTSPLHNHSSPLSSPLRAQSNPTLPATASYTYVRSKPTNKLQSPVNKSAFKKNVHDGNSEISTSDEDVITINPNLSLEQCQVSSIL